MSLFSFLRNFGILNRVYTLVTENLRASRGNFFFFILVTVFKLHFFCIFLGKYQKEREISYSIDLQYPAIRFKPAQLVNISKACLLRLSQHQIRWSQKPKQLYFYSCCDQRKQFPLLCFLALLRPTLGGQKQKRLPF